MVPVRQWPILAGRLSEQARFKDLLDGAAEGRPSAVLLHGETGVGKTALVRGVADAAVRDGFQVLWGSCLRFDASNALLLPLTMALERWLRDAGHEVQESVRSGVPELGALLPRFGPAAGGTTAAAPMMIVDALIDYVLTLGPTLLVVDDVQWADATSLSCLSYLIAGFSRQRLVVITIFRDEDVPRDDRVRVWAADMRRLPAVDVISLGRLNREATKTQVTTLVGIGVSERLIDEVYVRSGGNAYLTELLVSGVDPDSDELHDPLSAALRDALLARCERLTPAARALVNVLAVGGRPSELPVLGEVLSVLDAPGSLPVVLREAVEAGVVLREGPLVWLRHPLLAELLAESALDEEVAPIHAAWASVLSRASYEGFDEIRRLTSLALHCDASGDHGSAFATSMAAADLAAEHGSTGDVARNLVRATRLWQAGSPDPGDTSMRLTLLERAVVVCNASDRGQEAQALVEEALTLVNESDDPLRASRLLMHAADIAWETGARDAPPVDIVTRAVQLASTAPYSREHAEALSMLSNGLRWSGQWQQAASQAEEAVRVARRSASPQAIAKALDSHAWTRSSPAVADAETHEALASALESGDDAAISYAYGARALLLRHLGRHNELADVLRRSLEQALAHDRGTAESAMLVGSLLVSGDLRAAATVLRRGLSLGGMASWATRLRLHGAVLAARRGDLRVARMHRARAYELMPALEQRLGGYAVPSLAEVLVAESQPAAALELAHRVLSDHAVDPGSVCEALLWGARAAADLAELGQDTRDARLVNDARQGLADLLKAGSAAPVPAITVTHEAEPISLALEALVEAERRRAVGEKNLAAAWRLAADLCSSAGLTWEEQMARSQLGAEQVRMRQHGNETAASLRAAHHFAVAQDAAPLRERVERAAELGHIPLNEPAHQVDHSTRPTAFADLTNREAEVLVLLVASRTNTEIAAALFISAKTVSVHVTNLLRKTSTTSRQELAALATRLGWPEHTPRTTGRD